MSYNDNTNNNENLDDFQIPNLNPQMAQFFQFRIENFNLFLENLPIIRLETYVEDDDFNFNDERRIFNLTSNMIEFRSQNNRNSDNKYDQFKKYLQKRTRPIQNDKLNYQKPYIKVTQLRNMNFVKEYLINESGLINSEKTADSEDILIGRSLRNQPQDVIPNDIVLPDDRVISRIHCKIVSKDYFREEQIIDKLYVNCLKQIQLPNHIKQKISQFLDEPKSVFIQDLGSQYGTYLRVFRLDPFILSNDKKFSIGSETYFTIQHLQVYDQNKKQIDKEFLTLLKRLNTLKPQNKHEIHYSEQQNIEYGEYKKIETDQSIQLKDLYQQLKEYQIPALIVKFTGQGIDNTKYFNLFLGKTFQDTDDFYIGRGSENHVKISSNTISRKQCRLKYLKNKQNWVIFDGQDRDSANGTWVSLSTVEQQNSKQESDLIQIQNNSEIKISDFILRIEFMKGQPKKFNSQLLKELKEESKNKQMKEEPKNN